MGKFMGLAATAAGAMLGAPAAADDSLAEAIAAGRPILEMRLRYEGVEQQAAADDAAALTLRTRLGWETGAWRGFKALVEFEDVRAAGDYNDGVPPAEPYPAIADPETTELNRAQVVWTPGPAASATFGRQRIVLDDQRFVGASGWRQDEQTFDAARADFKVAGLSVTAAWLGRANRVFGEAQDWESDSWLLNLGHEGAGWLKPSAFMYALDFEGAPSNSSLTVGARLTGKAAAGPLAFAYAASLARQTDHGSAPVTFELGYRSADIAATYGPATVRAAYEALEGDGVRGFSTPLATLHAFQGWADVFAATPADGIEDRNLTLTLKPAKLELTARYHRFETERTGADLGEELDLMASVPIGKRATAVAKYADYDGVAGFADRRKVWIGIEFKL